MDRQIHCVVTNSLSGSSWLDYIYIWPWPPDIWHYFYYHTELSVLECDIPWGLRVIIPVEGRENILKHLNPGVSVIKTLARSYRYGGQILTLTLGLNIVRLVNYIVRCWVKLLCTPKNSQLSMGKSTYWLHWSFLGKL